MDRRDGLRDTVAKPADRHVKHQIYFRPNSQREGRLKRELANTPPLGFYLAKAANGGRPISAEGCSAKRILSMTMTEFLVPVIAVGFGAAAFGLFKLFEWLDR